MYRVVRTRRFANWGFDPLRDSVTPRRQAIADEIHQVARSYAATMIVFTRLEEMTRINPVAWTRDFKSRKGTYGIVVELAAIGPSILIYPIVGMYNFGVDMEGNVYHHEYRRNMSFTKDAYQWFRYDNVALSRCDDSVLERHLLDYLKNIHVH